MLTHVQHAVSRRGLNGRPNRRHKGVIERNPGQVHVASVSEDYRVVQQPRYRDLGLGDRLVDLVRRLLDHRHAAVVVHRLQLVAVAGRDVVYRAARVDHGLRHCVGVGPCPVLTHVQHAVSRRGLNGRPNRRHKGVGERNPGQVHVASVSEDHRVVQQPGYRDLGLKDRLLDLVRRVLTEIVSRVSCRHHVSDRRCPSSCRNVCMRTNCRRYSLRQCLEGTWCQRSYCAYMSEYIVIDRYVRKCAVSCVCDQELKNDIVTDQHARSWCIVSFFAIDVFFNFNARLYND